MVNDVTTGKALVIGSGKFFISFAPFIPKCEFEQPKEDYVDFETSFPFSHFVKDNENVELKFAVGGANYDGEVMLFQNGVEIGSWKGVQHTEGPLNVNLTADKDKNLRVLTYRFPKKGEKDFYCWITNKNFVIVDVDWTQKGESPELDECRKYGKPSS
ncbi:unnamed protein product, partial [Hymenolepis diminuta]